MHPIRANARVLTAAMVGTAVEFYDYYVYGTAAALVFGALFFPASSSSAQTLYALMSFGIAFFARPVGAIAFGHFGDRVGRKSTLVASMMLMGGCTLLIAFLPTYAMAGWIAPAVLCLLRFGQGFGVGGEWGGASLLAVEYAPPGWEGRFGTAPQLGSPIGFISANGLFLILGLTLSDADFKAWGWRVPFLVSAVLVAIGLWVRMKISETPAFRAAMEQAPPPAVPFARLMAHNGFALVAGSAGAVAVFGIFYLATTYALAQGTGPLHHGRVEFLSLQLGAAVVNIGALLLAAYLSDRFSPRRVMVIGCCGTMLLGLGFGPGLASASNGVVFATLAGSFLAMGFVYAPLGAWLSSLFPVPVRYSGISLAFNVGGVIGGGLTPLAAQMLAAGGHGAQAGWLLSLAGLVTLLGVLSAGAAGSDGLSRHDDLPLPPGP